MEKRLRILEVNTEKTWRGGERQTFFALKGFRDLNQDVALLAREGYPLFNKAQENGFRCYPVQGHWGVVPFFLRKGSQFDILHVQTASLLTFAILTKPFHKSKVVYTRRLDFVPTGLLTRWKYKQADLIVAITTPIKTILERFGIKKTTVIPECIEEKPLDKGRALHLLSELKIVDKKIIATTAALVQHKDPQTLVKSIEWLAKKRKDFVLLHFGEGILRQEIEKMIAEKHLEEQYLMMGFHQNVEDFFSIMQVFVMSSEEEGLGSSVLDAFIYGVPVVSTNAGGLAEILEGRGTLVPVKEYQSLAEELDKALDLSDHHRHLALQAQRFAKEVLTIENIHLRNLEAFKQLL